MTEPLTNMVTNKVIHERARLLIVTYLASSDEAEVSFAEIRDKLEMTAGNLSVQLKTLKNAGYITIHKQFKDDKPLTTAAITTPGRKALAAYVEEMERILKTLKG